jgi:diaminohydroxyphosphoribosylaminopyrimidine deaminase/5-amino-6-(5-phosphoribosylamino)uracil reductase
VRFNPATILAELGRRRFTNVLAEGGAGLHGSFIDANAVNEVWAFVAPLIVGGPGPSPVGGRGFAALADALRFAELHVDRCGPDVWVRGRVEQS